MSAFIVNTNVTAKVVTAILLNCDTFGGESTCRTALLAAPTDAQKAAGTKIIIKLFLMNRRALRARYGPRRPSERARVCLREMGGCNTVEQFKAMCCVLYQCCEGDVPNSRLYAALNRTAGELAQSIVQDLPEYEKAAWGD